MKRKDLLNNKKGFTLVELLAVIVILAIVATIGISTVLPQMEKARKEAVLTEANSLRDAGANAAGLLAVDTENLTVNTDYTDVYAKTDGSTAVKIGYCFTIAQLGNLGLYKNSDNKSGVVYVIKKDNTSTITYKYYTNFDNASDKYYVTQFDTTNSTFSSETVKSTAVKEGDISATAKVCEATSAATALGQNVYNSLIAG